ncbi:pyridoxal phosphate-dependent aminotransferase [[Eubacterium] cellulosolvens]
MPKKPQRIPKMNEDNQVLNLFNRIKKLEAKGINIINFAFGTPGFDTPIMIQDSASEILRTRQNPLVPLEGITELRMEVCDYIDRTRGFRPELDQILIGPSVKVMLFTTLVAILKKGEEVITTNPCLPYYSRLIEFLGADVKSVQLSKKNKYKLDYTELENEIGNNCKAIILQTPHNPTGNILTTSEIQKIFEIAEKNNLYIISDETYSQIVLSGRHISPATMDRAKERSIILESMSYTFNIIGWWIGFYIVPKNILEKLKTVIIDMVSPVPSFIQYAGVKAFQNADRIIPEVQEKYRKSARTLVDGLAELPGFKCSLPSGGIHAFPDISGTGQSSLKLAEFLLEKAGIAVLPGEVFGSMGKDHIRMSYASSIENINECLMRLDESF